jgi:menaquinone-9 beta-reductase
MPVFDVVIIGGGPAGAATAILLAEAGWSVAVVEQKVFPRRKVCGEYLSATNWPLLARLGIREAFAEAAGPPVTRTAIFSGSAIYPAPLPRARKEDGFGRALSRERLDTLLLKRAEALGACVLQPARCVRLEQVNGVHLATIEVGGVARELQASVAIAAHGSWDQGELPTQISDQPSRPNEWLAFKAHFQHARLPDGLMPLVSFQDGYGGMVRCDEDRVSLSFCIRRHRLARLERAGGRSAGEVALAHLLESCPAVREVLEGAGRDGPWLSAGVIRPGIRPRYQRVVGEAHPMGVFVVGNAAGEAHPVVAEGISMAMQGAWLLAEQLKSIRGDLQNAHLHVARQYSAAWRRAFAPRIYAAAAIAHWASRPAAVRMLGPLLAAFPGMVTLGARLSGKSRVVTPQALLTTNSKCCHA